MRSRLAFAAFGLATAVDLISLAVGFDAGHALAKPLLTPPSRSSGTAPSACAVERTALKVMVTN